MLKGKSIIELTDVHTGKKEIYNIDPAYPEKLLQRPALIPYIDCIYAAAWKDDCDNTRFDITFRSDYPKTYEEYVERIKSLLALGIPVCILAQKKTTITMIRKYRALGIHQFILNDDKLAARIKQEYPEVRLTLSITRALTLSELQTGDYSMYDRIVLFHWFARHLEALQQLPTGYQYTMIANSACYHDCKWHDEHWFLKGDTPENYAKEVGFKGICRKVLIFVLVGIGNVVDVQVLGQPGVLRTAIIFFYLSNEGLSLTENSAHLGLPIPEKLKAVLEQLHDRDSEEEHKHDE